MIGRGVVVALMLVGSALVASPAAPHAFLIKASPASRSSIPDGPLRVELSFNERLEPAYSTVSVWSADGTQVDQRDAGVDARDPKRLGVGLPALPAGEYTVRYRVLSVDGHLVEASYRFSVRPRRSNGAVRTHQRRRDTTPAGREIMPILPAFAWVAIEPATHFSA